MEMSDSQLHPYDLRLYFIEKVENILCCSMFNSDISSLFFRFRIAQVIFGEKAQLKIIFFLNHKHGYVINA